MPIRRLRVLAAAGLVLGLVGLGGCHKIQARGEIKRGNEFFKAGNYAYALGSYSSSLASRSSRSSSACPT